MTDDWIAQVRARWTGPMASWERAELDRLLACAEALDGLLRLHADPRWRSESADDRIKWRQEMAAAWERARRARRGEPPD